jgi:hypothetical protein
MDIQTDLQKPSKSKLWIVSTVWANIIIVSIILGVALKFLSLLVEKVFGLSGFLFLEGRMWPILEFIISVSALVYAVRLGVKSVLKESSVLQEDIIKIGAGVVSVAVFFQLFIAILISVFTKTGFRFDIYFDFLAIDIGYFVLTYFWLHKFNHYQPDNRIIKYLSALAIIISIAGAVLALGSIKLPSFGIGSNLNSDEAVGWETYTNKKYGFQFKYPAGTDILSKSAQPIEMGTLLVEPNSSSTNVIVHELKVAEGQRPFNEPTFRVDIITDPDWLDRNYPDLRVRSGMNFKFFSINGKQAMEAENFYDNLYKILVIEGSEDFFIVVRQNKKTDFLDGIFKTFTVIDREKTLAIPELIQKPFSYPYPISWQESGATFYLTGMALGKVPAPVNLKKSSGGYYNQGEEVNALVLTLKIQASKTYTACVPVNLKRELNEEGDMALSNTSQFYFPDTKGCMPARGASYEDQKVIFVVPESEKTFNITTGGQSNIFFTINLLEADLIVRELPDLQLEKSAEEEGIRQVVPYNADVPYCYDAGGNKYGTAGYNAEFQNWFVFGDCPHSKYYRVVPGKEIILNVKTDIASCSDCLCNHPNFSLYEYIGGSFKKTKEFNFPDSGGVLEKVYYTPTSDKIIIEANECFYLNVFQEGERTQVPTYADLLPTEITTPYIEKSIEAGDTVYFDSGIKNAGSVLTSNFNIKWFVDGVQVGYGGHNGIPAGAIVMNGNSQYTWTATEGTHKIKFVVDADNHIVESNEANNSATKTVIVSP